MKQIKVDDLGRIHLPKVWRDQLKILPNTEAYIDLVGDKLIVSHTALTKLCPVCNIVFSDEMFTFCPYCGQMLTNRDQSEEEPKNE